MGARARADSRRQARDAHGLQRPGVCAPVAHGAGWCVGHAQPRLIAVGEGAAYNLLAPYFVSASPPPLAWALRAASPSQFAVARYRRCRAWWAMRCWYRSATSSSAWMGAQGRSSGSPTWRTRSKALPCPLPWSTISSQLGRAGASSLACMRGERMAGDARRSAGCPATPLDFCQIIPDSNAALSRRARWVAALAGSAHRSMQPTRAAVLGRRFGGGPQAFDVGTLSGCLRLGAGVACACHGGRHGLLHRGGVGDVGGGWRSLQARVANAAAGRSGPPRRHSDRLQRLAGGYAPVAPRPSGHPAV